MTFVFHPAALDEYQEAASWHEEQRCRLGVEFIDAVERRSMSCYAIQGNISLSVECAHISDETFSVLSVLPL